MQPLSPSSIAALQGGTSSGIAIQAERSVEFLCTKYEALNNQLQKEEASRRDAEARTMRLELQAAKIAEKNTAQQAALTGELSSASETVKTLRGRVEDAGFRATQEQRQAKDQEVSSIKIEQRCQELERKCREEASKCAEATERAVCVDQEAAQWQQTCSDLERRLRQVLNEQSITTEDLRVVEQRALLLRDEASAIEKQLRDDILARESSEHVGEGQRKAAADSRMQLEQQEAQLEGLMTALEVAQDEKSKLELRITTVQEEDRRISEELALIAQHLLNAQREYTATETGLQRAVEESIALTKQLHQEEKAREHDSAEVASCRSVLVHTEAALEEAVRNVGMTERTTRDAKQQHEMLESEASREAARLEDLRRTHIADGLAFEDLKVELQAVFRQREALSEEREACARERNGLAAELRELGPALVDADRRCQLYEEDLGRKSRELEEALGHRRRCQREIAMANERARAFQNKGEQIASAVVEMMPPTLGAVDRFRVREDSSPPYAALSPRSGVSGTSTPAAYPGMVGSTNGLRSQSRPASPLLSSRQRTVGFASGGSTLASTAVAGVSSALGKHGLQYLKEFVEREDRRLREAAPGSRLPSAPPSPVVSAGVK